MEDLSISIISFAIGGIMLILSIYLLTGRGSFLIAGYNTRPKSEKEKYDAPALCRFMGKIFLPISILVALVGIEALHVLWFWIAAGVVFGGLLVFAFVYANTGNRFKK